MTKNWLVAVKKKKRERERLKPKTNVTCVMFYLTITASRNHMNSSQGGGGIKYLFHIFFIKCKNCYSLWIETSTHETFTYCTYYILHVIPQCYIYKVKEGKAQNLMEACNHTTRLSTFLRQCFKRRDCVLKFYTM